MPQGRRRRPCPLPRAYGPCGEPLAFVGLGATLQARQARKEAARAQARREAYETQQRRVGFDANGSEAVEYPRRPYTAGMGSRRMVGPLATLLAVSSLLAMPMGRR